MLLKQQTRKKRKPYTASSIHLMSSKCKLSNTIVTVAAGNIATKIISASSSSSSSPSLSPSSQQIVQQNQYTKYQQYQQRQLTEQVAVKPKFLTSNLVNTLMISLYITLLVSSLSTYPISVAAVAPKYETAYACEEKTLSIGCEPGNLINLIRANYGRFSITICNDHGNVDWSVNCMSAKSLRVLFSKCSNKQNCSVLASTSMFGDPCTGTHKYLEAHYQCVSASQTTSTTLRPSPPWLVTSQPSVWGTSTIRYPTTARIPLSELESLSTAVSIVNRNNSNVSNNNDKSSNYDQNGNNNNNKTDLVMNTPNRQKTVTKIKAVGTKNAISPTITPNTNGNADWNPSLNRPLNENASVAAVTKSTFNDRTLMGSGGSIASSSTSATTPKHINHSGDGLLESKNNHKNAATQSTVSANNNVGAPGYDDTNALFCGPTTARNLFWNFTRVGEVNVQPCPGGATGIAKWRCIHVPDRSLSTAASSQSSSSSHHMHSADDGDNHPMEDDQFYSGAGGGGNERGFMWQPNTPDLTQCRSLWLNNLEVRVNQRDSALVSIANDLSQVTNSKTLYGGDMLVTTKIIQAMCEKMKYDIEIFSDQRQRESIVLELLNSVVKTGSNLLDETQQFSWLDLSFEDQMRVATSLLTGLENNAFLLADTIAAERNVVQKVKNILLSVRVLETRNINGNQIFPDINIEQWPGSEDTIELPRGALIENSEGGLVRIVFVAFDRLESILKPLDSVVSNDQKQYDSSGSGNSEASGSPEYTPMEKENANNTQAQQSRVRILNSKVISASLGKGRHIQLSQPIRLVLKHLMVDNVTNPTCVFWNYIDHAWSEDGCHIDQTNRTHTICMCNHLTNFAILMDVIDDTARFIQQIGVFDENMRLLISISIAICIVFIVIALLTLKLFNGIFVKSNRTTIYKNLYICLLVTEVLIWLGNIQNESSMLCGFTTAFLHCAFLCSISWIFLEGFQSYIVLTTEEILLEVENSSRIISYYLITYGLSFTIVAISLGIDPSAYTIKADACVWMEQSYLFYVTFVLPCTIYILANFVYVMFSTHILCKKYKMSLKNKEHTRLASVRFYLRSSFIFEIIFVACWLCAYFYMVNLHSIYDSIGTSYANYEDASQANISFYGYGFVVLNVMQGAFILVFHCIQNEKIRREYRKFIRQQSWLPQCLQCGGKSIAEGDQATSSSPSAAGNNALAASSHHIGGGSFISASTQSTTNQQHASGSVVGQPSMSSTLMRHQTMQSQRHNAIAAYSTGTLREYRSGQQISPSSSAGSSKLKPNAATHKSHQYDLQKSEMIYPHSTSSQQFHQIHDDQPHGKMMHYDRKMGNNSKTLKSQGSAQQMLASPIKHDYSTYWTGTDAGNYKLNKTRRQNDDPLNSINKYSGSSSNHNELLQSQQSIQNYPSYKKKIMHYAQSSANAQSPSHLKANMRETFGGVSVTDSGEMPSGAAIQFGGREYKNRHSWLSNTNYNQQPAHHHHPKQIPLNVHSATTIGGNHYNSYGVEEPVYEEILSNRMSDVDDDGCDDMNMLRSKQRLGYNKTTDNCDADDYDEEDDEEADQLCLNDNDDLIQQNFRKGHNVTGGSSGGFIDPATMQQQPLHSRSVQVQSQQHQQGGQQPKHSHKIGRNISAMLNENNTVVCYLEPLPNS